MRSRDDDKPEVRISVRAIDPVQAEGDGGATTFSFVVTRKGALRETSVDWAVNGSGLNPAEASDFVGATFPAGTLTFAAGERRKTVTVEVAGDLKAEGTETFVFRVDPDKPKLHARQDSAEATIIEDDIPVFTTLAVGEEGEVTTMMVGEEGDPDPIATTLAIGEESEVTTQAVGEEGEPDPIYTTLAVGEEGGATTEAVGEEGEPPVIDSSSDPFGA